MQLVLTNTILFSEYYWTTETAKKQSFFILGVFRNSRADFLMRYSPSLRVIYF
jgi:hypothetical protein